jgi:hypothetical protein
LHTPIAYTTTTTTSKSASVRNFSRNFSGDISEKKIGGFFFKCAGKYTEAK